MDSNEIRFIQDQIGYEFTNEALLQQAFIRKSYSYEYGGQNNEVLEFIGDKVLDYVVVKLLCEKHGRITSDAEWEEYENDYSEGQLTEIKKKLVQKANLAYRIRMLDLEQFLIMGGSDSKNNAQNEDSVQEDLFEAIIGAIAIDSNWDMSVLQDAVEIMLNPDECFGDEENYVELIQEWTLRDSGNIPVYSYADRNYTPSNCISQRYYATNPFELFTTTNLERYHCILEISDDLPSFKSFGRSKSEARRNVCKFAYEYLEKNDYLFSIRDEIDEPSKDMAINQLEILARRGYFAVPTYDYAETHDANGNSIWQSTCKIEGESKVFKAKSSSKKEAKKQAAYKMLMYVMER